MAIARVQTVTAKDATGTSTAPSATFGATPAAGNLLVAYFAWNQNADGTVALTPPAGWTLVPTDGEVSDLSDVHHAIYYRVAGAAEPTTVAGALGQAERWGLTLIEYGGFAGTPTVDVSAQNVGAVVATNTGTTPATLYADELWLGFVTVKNIATQTAPTNGFAFVAGNPDATSAAPGADDVCWAALEKIVAATGTAQTGTTLGTARAWIASIVTFRAIVPPSNTGAPAITGNPVAGGLLQCSSGSWAGSPTSFAYAWQVNDGGGYVPADWPSIAYYHVPLDVAGDLVRCRVTATNPDGSSPPASAPAVTILAQTAHRVARAQHEVMVSWDKAVGLTGWFVLGSSLLSGTDKLAPASQLIPTFSGVYDDLSPYLVEATWSGAGRSSSFESVEGGQWRATFRDPDGRFNPDNAASPLFGYTDDPGRPFRHRAAFAGVWYPQFLGWTDDIEYEPTTRGRGLLHVTGRDVFVRLDVPSPAIGQLTATTTGNVIAACLAALGFTDPAYLALDVGDAIDFWPAVLAGETETVLAKIAEAVLIEFGVFWADAAGVARYESRRARQAKPVSYVIADTMRAHAPGRSRSRVINQATFTKEGGTPQTVTDSASADPVFGFGLRAAPEVRSNLLRNDDAAFQRANYVVQTRKTPQGDLYALEIDNRDANLLQAILDLGFSDRIQASEASTGGAFDGYVERVERSVSSRPYKETASYMVSKRSTINSFLLSSSQLSGTDVLIL